MKFLCDVHISFKVVRFLSQQGFEAIHINDILSGCYTSDKAIMEYADAHDLILISKDSDFRNAFHLLKTPKKLVKVSLGNTSTSDLIKILSNHLDAIQKLNVKPSFLIELDGESALVIIPE